MSDPSAKLPEGLEHFKDKTVADVLGQITWLMSQSPKHRGYFISDLEWLVMPAILLKQFRIFHRNEVPAACAIWAQVNEDVAARIRDGQPRLKVEEWRCGDIPVILEAIAPFGNSKRLAEELQQELDRVMRKGRAEAGQESDG